ncbi:MAG: thioredoxin family protein [Bacteroidales bacterium]|jgi:glutaredoxin|nr:thioredoxin family protein [Bacteroidales bacterium]
MNIIIAATKTCNHRPILEEQLQEAGLEYEVMFFEDHPELMDKYNLKTSPLFIVDEEIVSVGMPEHEKIMELQTEIQKNNE